MARRLNIFRILRPYLKTADADTRYYPRADVDGLLAGKAAAVHTHTLDQITDLATLTVAQTQVTGLAGALADKAPLASPPLTGTPTAPTAAAGTNTTQLATTAFCRNEIAGLVNAAPATLDTLGEIATQLASDESAAAALATTVAGKLAKSANLSDLASAAIARTNLGLGSMATQSAGSVAITGGTLANATSGLTIDLDAGTVGGDGVNSSGTWDLVGGILNVGGELDADAAFISGALTAATLAGDGSGLTALNASNLATGTVPADRLPSLISWGPVAGRYYMPGTNSSNTTLAADTIYVTPMDWGGGTPAAVGVILTTAGSAGSKVRMAVYSVAGGKPKTKLFDGGETAADGATGNLEAVLNQSLPQGQYALVVICSGGSPAVRNTSAGSQKIGFASPSATTATMTIGQSYAAGLPSDLSTFTPSYASGTVILIYLKG